MARINDWILNGNDPGNNAFEALHCAAVTTMGTAVGGLGAARPALYSRAGVGARRDGALRQWDDSVSWRDRGATRLGAACSADRRATAPRRRIATLGGARSSSPSRTSYLPELFGIEENATRRLLTGLQGADAKDHPDKGGSNEPAPAGVSPY